MTPITRNLNLQRLVLALATLSSLLMLGNAMLASYQVQRKQLIDSTLEANRVYASKLAQSTQHFIQGAQRELAYSAARLARQSAQNRTEEVERLKSQTDSFNSVVIVDVNGVVRAAAPAIPELHERVLSSAANRQALIRRSPLVSAPFIAPTGRLIITLSHPIFDTGGTYVGYITASIHLKERNVLHSLLGTHFYRDGSYLYVVGQDGKVLYHPDTDRIGELVTGNEAIRAVTSGEAGSLSIVNSRGVRMLTGFAPVPSVGWGIVAQRPMDATLAPLGSLMSTVLLNAAPLGALSLLLIWLFSRSIAKPLWKLASNVETADVGDAIAKVRNVNAWYFEAARLKKSVLVSFLNLSDRIGELSTATLTDPLTQLLNRRGLERALSELNSTGTRFGVVAIDVDHFKDVNDKHGHDVGDQVIASLAQRMRANARPQDILCRYGGEEFLALLPGVEAATAVLIAERLRKAIEQHSFPNAGQVTISAGVSHYPETETTPDLALKQADKALYRAKESGRNRVVLYQKRSQQRTDSQ